MATIPLWVLGKHFTSVSLRRQSVSTAGVVTDGGSGAVDLTAYKNGLTFNVDPVTEEINSDNSTITHEPILADSFSATFDALMPNNTAEPNPILAEFQAADIMKFVFTYGSGTSARTYTLLCRRGKLSVTSTGRGAAKVSAEFGPIDAGASTFAVS